MRRLFSKSPEDAKCPLKGLSPRFWGTIVFSILLAITAAWGSQYWLLHRQGPLQEDVVLLIRSGTSVQEIANRLQHRNIIADARLFRIAVAVMGRQEKLKAGEYHFTPHMSLKEVVDKLAEGKAVMRKVTIPEGLTAEEILNRLRQLPFRVDIPELAEGIEGTLYPDTYDYAYASSLSALLDRMKKRMEHELQEAWTARVSNLPLNSPHQLLILASIVEKESAKKEERARIAGVFINRLNKGMKLQSDPTVIYGASNYNGDLKSHHLKEDHAYNTYVHKGLPVGPICNPGREALMAVAVPEEHDYLYFVADGVTGGHVFAKSYPEHLQNVEKYLRIYRAQHKK